MMLVANARMYAVTPAIAEIWTALFEIVSRQSSVPLQVVPHAFPAPLEQLWQRQDLGAAFICGFPFLLGGSAWRPIAAPVPIDGDDPASASYRTDLIARADRAFSTLSDTFGGTLGFTVDHSHSGFNALRYHLLSYRTASPPTLYARTVGPLDTPRRVIEAVLDGRIDVGPLDSYVHDLLRREEPLLTARLVTLDRTRPAPIPFLVASPGIPEGAVHALSTAFLGLDRLPEGRALMERLRLVRFEAVDTSRYAVIQERAEAAIAAGYPMPA